MLSSIFSVGVNGMMDGNVETVRLGMERKWVETPAI